MNVAYCDLCGTELPWPSQRYGRDNRPLTRSLYNRERYLNVYTVTRAYVRTLGEPGDVCEACVGRIASEGFVSRLC